MPMVTVTHAEFRSALRSQGVPREHFAFECPSCRTVQSAHDLIAAGAGETFAEVEPYLGFSCVGRFTKDAGAGADGEGPRRGCSWTLGGLFQIHELEVVTEDGEHHRRFAPATPEAAQVHARANGLASDDEANQDAQ